MTLPAPAPRNVFRACVVNAVRGGEALMEQLVKVTQSALTEAESGQRNIQQRDLLSDSLRYLKQHEAALIKGYPMALLEIFAEGPSALVNAGRSPADDSGMDFGELSLMDDSEMQAQMELSKAQQSALHATDAVLSELNTLVSSAQGLRRVQPERNPLRPESYIRALQQVVGDTGASAEVRQTWMSHMRDALGKLLADEYRKTASSLREHGITPVGYTVVNTPSAGIRRELGSGSTGYGSVYGAPGGSTYGSGYSGYGPSMSAPISEYGGPGNGRGTGMGQVTGWSADSQPGGLSQDAEEALLTVGILRQMLAGGDPFDPRTYGGGAVAGALSAGAALMGAAPMPTGPGASYGAGWSAPRAGASSAQSGLTGAYYPGMAAAEAMEDIAQLERLVGRLAGSGPLGGAASSQPGSLPIPLGAWRLPPGVAPVVYATMPMDGATQSVAVAREVVARMMFNIAQDSRLLPSMQKAVQSLEPPLRQLVEHDGRFFSDGNHPARRLLDELTQRSLAFTDETAPGFGSFMRLVKGAVDHLTATQIVDAGPFDTVLKALQTAWETQEQKIKAHQQSQQKALLQAEQRELLAEKVAADIRNLPDVGQVPKDILEFASGPWADVVALAQVLKPVESEDDDPGGYLALVPVLLWSAQPDLTRQDPERLNEAIPGLLSKLRKGLKSIAYPAAQTSALLQRLVALHQAAFEKPAAQTAAAPLGAQAGSDAVTGSGMSALDTPESGAVQQVLPTVASDDPAHAPSAPSEPAPDPYADFVVGAWVELVTNGRLVRTQLTWASPHGTLFLFTASDASTQSMTRRMRDKLAAEGSLRVVPAAAPTAVRSLQASGDAGSAARRTSGSQWPPLSSAGAGKSSKTR